MTDRPRLSAATLNQAAPSVRLPAYDRAAVTPGIVHFGPGAFHRAHQAAYVDTVLETDPRWGISAVALNSTSVADALRPQDGLYTLALLDAETEHRVIGSFAEQLTGGEREAIAARLAASTTRLITSTVTEKGYCLTSEGGLDFAHKGIARDLADPEHPTTLIGWLVHGLALRKAAGVGGLTILSCDNLAANGRRVGRAVREYAEARDPELAKWIEQEVRFPSSMVDSITPATSDALRDEVGAAIGLDDAWPIQRERFTQWVIEDDFAGERPPFDLAGAQFTTSVEPFEDAKLRLLNGPHSTLAYVGLLLGHETVRDAMADGALAGFVERLMREDIAPVLHETPGLDVPGYISAILDRFRNPAIRHLLSQIAWDGSQKLPFRILGTLADVRAAGRPVGRLAVPIAAWIRFLAMMRSAGTPIVDPLGDTLAPLAVAGDVDAILDTAVFPRDVAGDAAFRDAVKSAHAAMDGREGVTKLLS